MYIHFKLQSKVLSQTFVLDALELQANLVGLLQQASKQLRRRVYNSPQRDQNIKVVFHTPKILQDYVHIISPNCTFLRGATIFVYRPGMLLDVSEDTVCLQIIGINKLRFWLEKKYFNKNFFRVHTSFVEVQILTALTFQIEAKHPETNNVLDTKNKQLWYPAHT